MCGAGEGTLNVSRRELVAASDATVTLAGALTRLSGSLSGSGSFVVSSGSVLESSNRGRFVLG